MGSALDGTRARGLDVSHHRPVTSWSELALAPEAVAFVGVKVSEGNTFKDPKFLWHREGFRASSLELCLYYHFAEPGDAREQAKRFAGYIGPLDPRERLCLDLERSPAAATGLSLKWVDDFYDELAGGVCTDRRPFIYTSKRQWDTICGGSSWLYGMTEVELWAPRYSSHADLEPLMPEPWKDRGWHVWQFSDGIIPVHSLAGVGTCDGDVWNGDRSSLRAYVAASVAPAPVAANAT
jgi:GH25 family lysozyme M1 (1,4-beta-N-acetylmuramidase)